MKFEFKTDNIDSETHNARIQFYIKTDRHANFIVLHDEMAEKARVWIEKNYPFMHIGDEYLLNGMHILGSQDLGRNEFYVG